MKPTHRFVFLVVPLVAWHVVGPTDARSQDPAQRDSIEMFRDELTAIDDSATLLAMEQRMIEVARVDRDNALLHVRLGFLAYRLGEVTDGRDHYDAAGSEFEWAAELEPDWPYAWYGLGLAELAMGEMGIIALENIRQVLGRDYLSKATDAFARAAVADPAFAAAVLELGEAARQQRIRSRADVALEAVRRAAATGAGGVPDVQLLRGRLERMVGAPDSALAAFGRYLALGGDSGVGQLERARSLFRTGRPEAAARAYYDGAEHASSPAARALYREDVGWVATPEELAEFDASGPEALGAWLGTFWRERDAREVRAPGARLAEHYRRYFYALARFRLVSRHRRYDVSNPYRNTQQTFDDRGIIYLRHGEPSRVAVHNDPGIDPNQTWLYVRPEGNLVFHFVARDDVQDYKLVESVADVMGLSAAITLQAGGAAPPEAEALFASRVQIDPVYQRLAAGQQVGRERLLAAERSAGERSIARGTATDSYLLRFEESLEAVVREYVVGRPGGGGQVLVVFAIPGDALTPETADGTLTYAVTARIVATTPEQDVAAFLDTTRAYTSSTRLGENEHLADLIPLSLPPGNYVLRVALVGPDGTAGDLARADSVAVPDFAAGGLVVSDLIVGTAGSGLSWVAAGDTVDLSPLGYYPATADLTVYYQVHGLERGAAYRARLEIRKEGGGSVFGFIRRLFGGGGPRVTLAFEGVASGPLTPVSHRVDASELSPGRYRLRLEIDDVTGGWSVEREMTIEIAEP